MKRTIPFFALIIVISLFFACTEEAPVTPVSPVIDHIAPFVEWVDPVSGSELSGTVELVLSIYDENSIDRVAIYRNGSLFGEGGHSCPPNCSDTLLTLPWNTEDVPDGIYILEARACDEAGNLGISPSLVVNVKNNPDPPPEDRLPPDVWWVSPDGGSTLSGTVSLQVRFYDESSVDSVRLLKNGAAVATYIPPYDSRGDSTNFPPYYCRDDSTNFPPYDSRGGQRGGQEFEVEYLWNTLPDSDGVYIWEARAWDEAGNMGVSPSLLIRVRNNEEPPPEDRTPPVVTWLSPEPGSTVEGVVELRFHVMDDVGLDSVKVYLNGQELQNLINIMEFFDANVIWITSDYPDGNYIVEVRVWDSSGNMGAGVGVVLTVMNNVPRVIWVPDDFEKIQDAINASEDGDTVRVRAGTYREGLRITRKTVWLESEEGPEETLIIGTGYSSGINAQGELVNLVVRGFTVSADYNGIHCFYGSIVTICNCIIKDDFGRITGIPVSYADAYVYNCIVDGANWGTFVGYNEGCFFNSIFTNCIIGYYQRALCENWVALGWNLFWQNERDYRVACRNDEPQESDIFEDPRFVPGSYRLQQNSPAIDRGNPDLLDRDGSRSDIGVYGGLYAY